LNFIKSTRRFPQGPRRQVKAVANTPLAVDDRDLNIARQTIMLETIIGHDYVSAQCNSGARIGNPIRAGDDRDAASLCDQHRFVTH
jgi:hypothetical protein